jgi:hypothetical protein
MFEHSNIPYGWTTYTRYFIINIMLIIWSKFGTDNFLNYGYIWRWVSWYPTHTLSYSLAFLTNVHVPFFLQLQGIFEVFIIIKLVWCVAFILGQIMEPKAATIIVLSLDRPWSLVCEGFLLRHIALLNLKRSLSNLNINRWQTFTLFFSWFFPMHL